MLDSSQQCLDHSRFGCMQWPTAPSAWSTSTGNKGPIEFSMPTCLSSYSLTLRGPSQPTEVRVLGGGGTYTTARNTPRWGYSKRRYGPFTSLTDLCLISPAEGG